MAGIPQRESGDNATKTEGSGWLRALWHALPVSAFILALFYYWFAVADRYIVFLYYHDMGQETSPFSFVTSSRYWMAGLIACGGVLLLYTIVNWALGRIVPGYCPPVWWRVWLLSAMPMIIGIPLLTMTTNHPALPWSNAMQVTLATLIGLALALWPGQLVAQRPGALIWLALDGIGIMLILLGAINIEDAGRWLARGRGLWVGMTIVALGIGMLWLILLTALRFWRHRLPSSAPAMLAAGFGLAYLLMPLTHHLLGTDGYFYISNSANFFADTLWAQLLAWLLAAVLAWAITALRSILSQRQDPAEP